MPFLIALLIVGCASVPVGRRSIEGVLRRHLSRSPALRLPASKEKSKRMRKLAVLKLQRPLRTSVRTSSFGRRNGRPHRGIDLHAPRGTSVYAAAEGLVVYADDSMRGYGETVVILHAGKVATVYAHLDEILVDEFSQVVRGEHIGRVGSTGNASGPHLHFEVRDGLRAINPARHIRFNARVVN